MNEKPVKVDIDFSEALRRIARTPKEVVEEVVNQRSKKYNQSSPEETQDEKPHRQESNL